MRALFQVDSHCGARINSVNCNMIALDSECPLVQMDADRRTWSGWGGHRSRQVDIWVGRSVVLTYDSARGPHQVRDELRSMECGRKEGGKGRADFGIGMEQGGRLLHCIV